MGKMDASSIATITGKQNEEFNRDKGAGSAATERWQQNDENDTELERGTKVPECVPELICIKQEPHDVDVKEEMVLENEERFEEPVLANRIKKRWHEFGLELPQPVQHEDDFLKHDTSDEINKKSTIEASCSGVDSTSLPEQEKFNQELQEQTFPSSAPYGQQQTSEMVFGKEEAHIYEDRTAQKRGWRISPRNNIKQVEEYMRGQSLEMISAFSEEHLQPLYNSLGIKSGRECFNQLHFKEMQDSAFKTLLVEREELYKTRERIRKSMARASETPQQRRRRLDKMCVYINEKRATENSEEREERLLKLRIREAQRRANETPEQRAYRLHQNRLYARKRRANQTPEEREQRLLQGRMYEAQRRASETPEQREQRLIRMRLTEAKRRANESPEERERRLIRTRVSEAQRRASETEDEREQRLVRMRTSEAQRRASETTDARTNRLAKARITEAQRRANETPEEREKRLIRMRLNEAHRRANETPEQREQRLLRIRLYEAERRANETPKERENRLNRMRLNEAQRRANETPEEREQRLSRMRWSVARRRVNETPNKRRQELDRMQVGLIQEYTNETPMILEHHLISSHFIEPRLQAEITREEQVQNYNMYLSIAKQIENKTVEQGEKHSTELDLRSAQCMTTTYEVPKEQEQFLLNMHLSKTEEEKTSNMCN